MMMILVKYYGYSPVRVHRVFQRRSRDSYEITRVGDLKAKGINDKVTAYVRECETSRGYVSLITRNFFVPA